MTKIRGPWQIRSLLEVEVPSKAHGTLTLSLIAEKHKRKAENPETHLWFRRSSRC